MFVFSVLHVFISENNDFTSCYLFPQTHISVKEASRAMAERFSSINACKYCTEPLVHL